MKHCLAMPISLRSFLKNSRSLSRIGQNVAACLRWYRAKAIRRPSGELGGLFLCTRDRRWRRWLVTLTVTALIFFPASTWARAILGRVMA